MSTTTATDSTRTIVTGSKSGAPIRRAGSRNREQLVSWAFLTPFLIAFALFLVWPIVHGIILSFTDQSLTGAGGAFVGFANYAESRSPTPRCGSRWATPSGSRCSRPSPSS